MQGCDPFRIPESAFSDEWVWSRTLSLPKYSMETGDAPSGRAGEVGVAACHAEVEALTGCIPEDVYIIQNEVLPSQGVVTVAIPSGVELIRGTPPSMGIVVPSARRACPWPASRRVGEGGRMK